MLLRIITENSVNTSP